MHCFDEWGHAGLDPTAMSLFAELDDAFLIGDELRAVEAAALGMTLT